MWFFLKKNTIFIPQMLTAMGKSSNIYGLILFFLIAFGRLNAQDQFETVLENSINRVNQLLDSSNVFLLKNTDNFSYDKIPGFLYLSGNILSESNSELSNQYFDLKTKYLKSDLGIRVTGNYNNNFKGGFAEDDEDFYNQRVYLGLEWNALQTGVLGNKKKIKSLEHEKQLNTIELKESNLKREYFFTRQYITASFVTAQNPYLKQRLDVLWGLYDIYQELFYLKRVDWERLLKVKGEIKKVELLLKRNEQMLENSGFQENELLRVDGLPIFSVNTDAIFNGSSLENFDSLKYAIKINDIENNYEDYFDNISVRPYVRYNFYDFLSTSARSYPSAGVSLNIPVNKSNGKKSLVKVEQEMLNEMFVREKDQFTSDVLDLNRSYEERIQDFVFLVYQRDLLKEKISRELRKREINLLGFNGVKALSFFDEFLDFEADILDKKKDIYLRLLDLCLVTKGENPDNYLLELGYDLSFKNFPGNRGVYMWSELFNVMNNDHIISFMEDREINWVLVSLGKASNEDKLHEFFKELRYHKIRPIGLIGNNDLVNHTEEHIISYLNAFSRYDIEGIHFDVEPHVFDDYHDNKEEYLEKLLWLYGVASEWCRINDYTFSVSVPFHYPVAFINDAFKVCDRIYIMNYGAKDEQQLINRVKVFINDENSDKLVVAMRPSDYPSLKALDYSLLHLTKESGIKNFAFSDLRGLNRMTTDLASEAGDSPEYSPYRIETGAFKSVAEAQGLADQLKKSGYEGQITWKRNGTYCVVLGYFNNFDTALRVMNRYQMKWTDLPKPWIYMVH